MHFTMTQISDIRVSLMLFVLFSLDYSSVNERDFVRKFFKTIP
jgi:hypothetical protein